MSDRCVVCGEPLEEAEKMFRFHGSLGPCPAPPLPPGTLVGGDRLTPQDAALLRIAAEVERRRSDGMPAVREDNARRLEAIARKIDLFLGIEPPAVPGGSNGS